jgi:hypothetical protein
MVTAIFNVKALSKGEYEPCPGCDGFRVNHLELIGIITNVVLSLVWDTTITFPEGVVTSRYGPTAPQHCRG